MSRKITGNSYTDRCESTEKPRNNQVANFTENECHHLFSLIINQSSNIIIVTDIYRKIIFVNKKFEEITGFSFDEARGKSPKFLRSNQTKKETYNELHSTIYSGYIWRGELTNKYRKNQIRTEKVVISPIHDNENKIIYFLSEQENITEKKEIELNIKKTASLDPLTGLYNRLYFMDELNRTSSYQPNDSNHFSILFLDLNHFKIVNDTFGHQIGDHTLLEAANAFRKCIHEKDLIARVGGDEFVVLHRNASPQSTEKLANALSSSLIQPLVISHMQVQIGVSIGSSIWPNDSLCTKQLLTNADLAMYSSKLNKTMYVPYTKSLLEKQQREQDLSKRLRNAVELNQLSIVYQPKVHLISKEIIGLEALLRWKEPSLGNVDTREFTSVAEKHNLMYQIGNWVIEHSFQQLNSWQKKTLSFTGRLSINLSTQQLEHPDFHAYVLSTLKKYHIKPHSIEFEITESVLLHNTHQITCVLKQLKSIGISIAIDNFGTGYSSLPLLKKINVTTLKIDSSLITDINRNTQNDIIRSIIKLSHNLGLAVVAEGVENQDQLEYLLKFGCDMAQGYLFSEPKSAESLCL